MMTKLNGGATSSVSVLQEMAWAACNASYHEPNPDEYRMLGRSLYREAVRDRIAILFARSDEQNARLDAMLAPEARP
jgi:hypothetical protein